MKVKHLIYIIFLIHFGYSTKMMSQLSPGILSKPHSNLEGIANCTKCHDIGKKVTNEKCLNCHTEIKSRIENKKGYHISSAVREVSCFSCHNEHHGLNFEIVRFDKNKFDHKLTGYELTGSHLKTDCAKCHTSKFVQDVKIKTKPESFLGLVSECNACHTDVHKGELGLNCFNCHTTEKFKPALKFDHKKSNYPLEGKHKEVDCMACHKTEINGDKKVQHFKGLKYDQCSACHTDPHSKNFGPNCIACHRTESFTILNSKINLNHTFTGFQLKGKHRTIDCKDCHTKSWNNHAIAFKEYTDVKSDDCIQCHEDKHEKKFGSNCSQCHTEQTFKVNVIPIAFEHDKTDYKLEGRHESVDCNKCHKANKLEKIPHSQCVHCHADYHQEKLNKKLGLTQDCSRCHTVQNFTETIFDLDQHNRTNYVLRGAHQAVSCDNCHKKEADWKFVNVGTNCTDCHQDIHTGYLDSNYNPDPGCINCHTESSWSKVNFKHSLTRFELKGRHTELACSTCHARQNAGKREILFKLEKFECTACHNDIHQNQFSLNGQNQCLKCHEFDNWKIQSFDHSRTNFQLEGAHIFVSCDRCHKTIQKNGFTCVQYKFDSYKCIDCHY